MSNTLDYLIDRLVGAMWDCEVRIDGHPLSDMDVLDILATAGVTLVDDPIGESTMKYTDTASKE